MSLNSAFIEQRKDDLVNYRVTSLLFGLCFFFELYSIGLKVYSHFSLKLFRAEFPLFFIIASMIIGFGYSSFKIYKLVKITEGASMLDELKNIKIEYYKIYFYFISIPYLAMTLWLFINGYLYDGLQLIVIYLGAVCFMYFRDWRPFLRLFESAH